MRVVTVMAVLLLGGAATLEAQHRFQFEMGGFASFTRFDRALQLDNQIGGGGRLGFWITNWLGIEGDGLYMRPHPKGGGAGTDFPGWVGSGRDRKSTRLNSSHDQISYAGFCLKKKNFSTCCCG